MTVADVGSAERPVSAARNGDFGVLNATVATPLALVLNELLQNAVQHGGGEAGVVVTVRADRLAGRLRVAVCDEGPGLPPGFDADAPGSLGLQIVRTLVLSELGGVLELRNRHEPPHSGDRSGVEAVVDVPLG
jgi:two-component sensor histidine kinase